MILELDDDTFTLVLEAVRRQTLQWRDYHANLDDEHVLHLHHGRAEGAVITDGLRTQAARTLADYQRVLAFLQAQSGTGQPPAGAAPQP